MVKIAEYSPDYRMTNLMISVWLVHYEVFMLINLLSPRNRFNYNSYINNNTTM